MKNRIGIVGGGQLGRMLAFEAKKMGFHVTVVDPTSKSPASQVVDEQIIANYDDESATKKLASVSDFITIEIEHINTKALHSLTKSGIPVNPAPETVDMIKDKYNQKVFLRKNKIATADFIEISSELDIKNAGKKFGYPLLLKTKHGAFDGRGNVLIKKESYVNSSFKLLFGKELYVEKFVPFKKELAIMIARSSKGEIAPYDVVETIHENNICHIVKAPAQVDKKIIAKAKSLGMKVMNHLKGAGVFGIELFLTKDNNVLINDCTTSS
jgi:5-(carboxyamino)imidazole ribonucleotide synthase